MLARRIGSSGSEEAVVRSVTYHVCPACLVEGGVETERDTFEGGLKRTFECEDCGHIWNVVF